MSFGSTFTTEDERKGLREDSRSDGPPPKLASDLARRIVADIRDRGLEPGERLESERNMAAEFRVARGTLRESLRFLEMEGVLEFRPGPRGGPIVTSPTPRNLASSIALLLHRSDAQFRDVLEVREVIESSTAEVAALSMREDQLESLERMSSELDRSTDDLDRFLEAYVAYHGLIADAGETHLSRLLHDSLMLLTRAAIWTFEYPVRRRREVVEEHVEISAAIRSRDGGRANAAMHRYFQRATVYLEREHPRALTTPMRWQMLG